jgi:adenylate cyclase
MDIIPMFLGLSIMLYIGYSLTASNLTMMEEANTKLMMERYLSPQLVTELYKNNSSIEPGGKIQKVTILFSDIRGFTAFAESRAPEEVVAVINDYFEKMSKVIIDFGGTLDKYVGDQIMAVWNAPTTQKNHAELAVRSALAQLKALKSNEQIFDISIGINTGEVIVGNMGSSNHLNYTVMGDAVNLAARLQTITREYDQPGQPCRLIISQSTYDQVKNFFRVRPLGKVMLKGKSIPVAIYEVLEEVG